MSISGTTLNIQKLTVGGVDVKEIIDVLNYNNAGSHNALYRGKNLGNALTAAQSAAIRAGTFDDLYIGDYWQFTNVPYEYYWPTKDTTAQSDKTYYADASGTALPSQPSAGTNISSLGYFEKLSETYSGIDRLANFNYHMNSGDTVIQPPHAVVLPGSPLFNAPMNATNTTAGGYAGCKMREVYLRRAEAIFKACFGEDHVLKHRIELTTAVANGKPTAGAWFDSVVDLLNEPMVFGSYIFAPANDGTTIPYRQTESTSQLALFRHRPDLIVGQRTWWWLRDVVSDTDFSAVGTNGHCGHVAASNTRGSVRPYALIY